MSEGTELFEDFSFVCRLGFQGGSRLVKVSRLLDTVGGTLSGTSEYVIGLDPAGPSRVAPKRLRFQTAFGCLPVSKSYNQTQHDD